MTEFFILRAHCRQGIGASAAQQVWSRFPGPWTVRVMRTNTKALAFWQQAIMRFTGKPIEPANVEKDGIPWHVFTFESQAQL
jgi:predicted acetyltransferase